MASGIFVRSNVVATASLLAALSLGDQPDFLQPDVIAQYEAGSGVMLVNADFEDFKKGRSDLLLAVNHETYHHLQTVCTGFGWRRSDAIGVIVLRHINEAGRLEYKDNAGFYRAIRFLNWLPASWQKNIDVPRIEATLNMMIDRNRLARMLYQQDPDDPSAAATEYPGLFRDLEALRKELWTPRDGQIADGHVMEAAPVAHEILLSAATSEGIAALSVDRAEELDRRIVDLAGPLGPEYTTLFDATYKELGGSFCYRLLCAAAVALYYERPGGAFLHLAKSLPAASFAEVVDATRVMSEHLPDIVQAGSLLGTARQVLAREARKWRWPWHKIRKRPHDEILRTLTAQPSRELEILTDLVGYGNLDKTIIGCVARFNDRVVDLAGRENEVILAWLMQASVVLRALTRRTAERELEARLAGWGQSVLANIAGPPETRSDASGNLKE